MSESFYYYQHRRLGLLLGWGLANSAAGALALLPFGAAWRQFWGQAGSWGAINVALAWFGRRGAGRKQALRAQAVLDSAAELQAATRFRQVLLVNAGLDVLYILGGGLLAWRQWQRPDRRGIGLGIVPQGLFLLLYDLLLAREVARRFERKH